MKVGQQASYNMDIAAPPGWKHLADLSPVKVQVNFSSKRTPIPEREWYRMELQFRIQERNR